MKERGAIVNTDRLLNECDVIPGDEVEVVSCVSVSSEFVAGVVGDDFSSEVGVPLGSEETQLVFEIRVRHWMPLLQKLRPSSHIQDPLPDLCAQKNFKFKSNQSIRKVLNTIH